MKLSELKSRLSKDPDLPLRFQLPNGEFMPAHAHITEVARVEKRFIDCGGMIATEKVCRLQLWVANDVWHRFNVGKLLAVLSKAEAVLGCDDLPVDVEYDLDVLTQSPIESVELVKNGILVKLKARHAACLARERKRERRAQFFQSLNPLRLLSRR